MPADRNDEEPGRHPTAEIEVDARLELDISAVEQAVGAYLDDPSATHRRHLLTELERLDEQIEQGDDYTNMPLAAGALGYLPNPAIGATSANSPAETLPDDIFRAQIDLVNAAKNEVRGPTADTQRALRRTAAALNAERAARADGRIQTAEDRTD